MWYIRSPNLFTFLVHVLYVCGICTDMYAGTHAYVCVAYVQMCVQVHMPMCLHAEARGRYQEPSIIPHLSF